MRSMVFHVEIHTARSVFSDENIPAVLTCWQLGFLQEVGSVKVSTRSYRGKRSVLREWSGAHGRTEEKRALVDAIPSPSELLS